METFPSKPKVGIRKRTLAERAPEHDDSRLHIRAKSAQVPDHTLLRVIGCGSYGVVWLALNVMGTLRAVKIIRRDAFDSDKPWLREFEGIRRCEPVSRAHEGLIDILHMGRNDEEGFFYYVMELADTAEGTHGALGVLSGSIDTDSPAGTGANAGYTPATLSARLARGMPLDVPSCLRLAESLAGALAFLHERGLVHRDVKPSNVLYFGGAPKLGDVGLLTSTESSRSFVGTEGFVPPEGPGTSQADIFALGKVLYEALTGQDRNEFPRLPSWWLEDAEFVRRVELNEIVLRACEGDPVRRYHTAREMLAEVAILASGCSLKRLRLTEQRLRLMKWTTTVVAGVALAASGISALWQQQAERERALRQRAEHAENSAEAARFEALLNLVHAARQDQATGAVARALGVVMDAATMGTTSQLRDDAIFLLGRSEFVQRPDLAFSPPASPLCAFDAASLLSAEMPRMKTKFPGPLTITLKAAGAPATRRELVIADPPSHLHALEFSAGGARLLMSGSRGAGVVLDTRDGKALATFAPSSVETSLPVFCGAGGDAVVRRSGDGGLEFYAIPLAGPSGASPPPGLSSPGQIPEQPWRRTPELLGWPPRDQTQHPQRLWPSPDGRFVLLIDPELRLPGQSTPAPSGVACLVDCTRGTVVWQVPGPDEDTAAWSPDGTRIALRRGDDIVSIDATTGQPVGQVPGRVRNRGTQMIYLGSRDLLAFSTWSMAGLCDLACEEMLGNPPVLERWSFSQGHGLLVGGTGVAEWRPSAVLRTLRLSAQDPHSIFVSFSPDDRWLITGLGSDFSWWDLELPGMSSTPTAVTPANGARIVLFSSDAQSVQFLDQSGRHDSVWTGEPPASLTDPLEYGSGAIGGADYVSASTDGDTIAFSGRQFVIARRGSTVAFSMASDRDYHPVELSPDGRWLALGAQHGDAFRVFDLHGGESSVPVLEKTAGPGNFGAFSPDGRWLAYAGVAENSVLETGTWRIVHRRHRYSRSLVSFVDFSPDGRFMAVRDSPTRIGMLEPGTWRTLFHLDSPLNENFERSSFSSSGRYFAAVGTRGEVYVWDLDALEDKLDALGLGLSM